MRRARFPSSILLLALALGPACGDKNDDTAPPEGDADTDSDGDADADSDADSDSDADADSDSDSDTDTDPNAPPTLGAAASVMLVGNSDGDFFGNFVTGGGDLNGDGLDDVIAMAGMDGTHGFYEGVLYVFGGTFSAEMIAADATAIMADSTILGNVERTVILGDANGDGFDDFAVADGNHGNAGLYLGPVAGERSFDDYDAVVGWFDGSPDYQYSQVFAAGDVDGNGTADLIVDEGVTVFVMATPLSGQVDVERQARAVLEPPRPSYFDPCVERDPHYNPDYYRYERNGRSAAVGDLDGDGFGELVVTNWNWNEQWWTRDPSEICEGRTGGAWVVQGPVSGTVDLATSAIALEGEERDGVIFGDVEALGDANGDGFADFVVEGGGQFWDEKENIADYIVFGPLSSGGAIADLPNVAIITGSEYSSSDIAGAGDVDGDGLGDIVMGIRTDDYWDHGVAIMLAPFSGTRLIEYSEYLFRGEGENSWAGSSVSSAGDVDADGLMDVIVGAPVTQVDGEYRGKVYLLYGTDL